MNLSIAHHTVTAFDAEIHDLRAMVLEMGEKSTSAITRSIEALEHSDLALAKSVVADDREIDALERRIDSLSIQTIALRAPMADDLRHLIATFKISSLAERIGDYAKNIAKRVPVFEKTPDIEPLSILPSMARIVAEMVHNVLDAFAARDAAKAVEVIERDRAVDDFYNSLFRALLTFMMENSHNITQSTHLLFIAKNLERVGDHATNIAEMVYFAATGEHIDDRTRLDEPLTAKEDG